jgi:nitrite reductase/ring-hydroxylating ferredoxin subunit
LIDEAKLSDILTGSLKKVEHAGKEILLVNVNGRIFVTGDHCGHMNAPLSMGTVDGIVVECPLHHARFDVTKGKATKAGQLHGMSGAVISATKAGSNMEGVRTYGLRAYQVVIEGDAIKLMID